MGRTAAAVVWLTNDNVRLSIVSAFGGNDRMRPTCEHSSASALEGPLSGKPSPPVRTAGQTARGILRLDVWVVAEHLLKAEPRRCPVQLRRALHARFELVWHRNKVGTSRPPSSERPLVQSCRLA